MTISIPPIEVQRELRNKDAFDKRNVVDRFKGMDNEAIKSILKSESSELVVCISSLIRDLNAGSVVRSANSFNVNKVIFAGRKNYDRRGAVGMQNYTDIEHWEEISDVIDSYRADGYTVVAAEFDETRFQYNLCDYNWNEKSLLIVGEEGIGIPSEVLDSVDDLVYIPMMGSVRSLNLASAATTFMYDYHAKSRRKYVR